MSKFTPAESDGNVKAHGWYYSGMSALGQHSGSQFIIIAPDMAGLTIAWNLIMSVDIREHDCQPVICTAPRNLDIAVTVPTFNEMINRAFEPKRGIKTTPPQPDDFILRWFYLPGANQCMLEYNNCDFNGNEFELIGKAEKQTVMECKLLLRRLGWDRVDIDKLSISTEEPVPF